MLAGSFLLFAAMLYFLVWPRSARREKGNRRKTHEKAGSAE